MHSRVRSILWGGLVSAPTAKRNTQGFLHRPLVNVQAFPEDVSRQSGVRGPLKDGSSLPVVSDVDISSGVVGLRFPAGPSTVAGFVVAGVVDPVETHALRALAHVGQERFKRVDPSLANDYPSPTVPLIVIKGGRVAPRLHGHPAIVRARLGESVGARSGLLHISMKAPARSGLPAGECVNVCIESGAAFTCAVRSASATVAKFVQNNRCFNSRVGDVYGDALARDVFSKSFHAKG